jgi:mRNA interferase RelE/StbE
MYEVEIEASAAKQLLRLDRSEQRRITTAIRALATDPRPHGAVKLSGSDGFRIRIGNYRVIYIVDDTVRIVTVTRVGHRRDIYRGI